MYSGSDNFAIILAGGTGSRAGGLLPKQFQPLCGRPVLWWSVRAFREFDPGIGIVVVMHPEYIARWDDLMGALPGCGASDGIALCEGGPNRVRSVFCGLRRVAAIVGERGAADGLRRCVVAVHDGARPLVSPEVIAGAFEGVSEGCGNVPAVPLADSIRILDGDGESSAAVDRSLYRAVQTPQTFMLPDLLDAYGLAMRDGMLDDPRLTDDASVAERAGIRISLCAGDPSNIKVTYPADFLLAAAILGS